MANTLKVIEDGRNKKKLQEEVVLSFCGVTPLLSPERSDEILQTLSPKGCLTQVPTCSDPSD